MTRRSQKKSEGLCEILGISDERAYSAQLSRRISATTPLNHENTLDVCSERAHRNITVTTLLSETEKKRRI